jgi:hypothetical protein
VPIALRMCKTFAQPRNGVFGIVQDATTAVPGPCTGGTRAPEVNAHGRSVFPAALALAGGERALEHRRGGGSAAASLLLLLRGVWPGGLRAVRGRADVGQAWGRRAGTRARN